MMVMPGSRLMVGSFVTIARVGLVSVVLVVVHLEYDLAECKMLMATGSS